MRPWKNGTTTRGDALTLAYCPALLLDRYTSGCLNVIGLTGDNQPLIEAAENLREGEPSRGGSVGKRPGAATCATRRDYLYAVEGIIHQRGRRWVHANGEMEHCSLTRRARIGDCPVVRQDDLLRHEKS